jgi:hypothetical protein
VGGGEFSNLIFNQKLAMCGSWQVIEYDFESKTSHAWVVATYRILDHPTEFSRKRLNSVANPKIGYLLILCQCDKQMKLLKSRHFCANEAAEIPTFSRYEDASKF